MTAKNLIHRRNFMRTAGAAALSAGVYNRVSGANDRVILGQIGAGGRGQTHLKILTHVEGVTMGAVCDLRDDRIEQAMNICQDFRPETKPYKDFRQMLEKEKLDGVIVATEVGNHAKCVIPVLEAGLNCFSEKPMDCTVEKVDQIVKAARKAKGIYQIGFQRRYAPGFQAAVKAVHDGIIGDITFLQGQWQWTWSVGGWVGDVDMSGGELVEQACHHMDVMQWVMKGQHPIRCAAMGNITRPTQTPPEHNSEDHSAVMYEFPGGVIYSYTHVFYACEEFTGEKLWVYGQKGGVDLVQSVKYPRPNMGEKKQLGEPAPSWEYGTPNELEAFLHHIRNNEKPLSNEETGRISTLISLMGRQAMYKRKTKTFEPAIVTWNELGSTT